jgi:hypothetical protein
MVLKDSLKDEWLGPMTEAVKLTAVPTPDVLVRDAGTLFLFCLLTHALRNGSMKMSRAMPSGSATHSLWSAATRGHWQKA